MFKTIFGKQFAAYVGTLVIGFGLLGLVLINLFQSYFVAQKTSELEQRCVLVKNAVVPFYVGSIFRLPIERVETLRSDLKTISLYTGWSFFLFDKNYENPGIYAYTSDIDENSDMLISLIQSGYFSDVLDGENMTLTGNLNGIFPENMLTVGYPVTVSGEIVAAVFTNAPLTDIESKTHDVMRLTVTCLLISATISFILIYFTSKTISKPIHKITEAAKVIADGNFERRIYVKSADEVGQLAESFNNMAESLNNQEIHRREFIANISHDLRSPLTSIKGFLQAIIDGTVPNEKQERYLNIILDETERLSKLANDIMDISKIQNMDMGLNMVDFDINEMIRQTAISLETRITAKKIEMSISFAEEKTVIAADREKIQRVIYNLLDNAVKFTDAGGIVSIETTLLPDENKVKLSVKDSGIGISPEDQKRIFDRFYKADISRGEDKKGSGLGLSIVREFIKAHGETIELYSEINRGCEFVFKLPLKE